MSTVTINGQAATREEWLAIRRGSIGASDAPVVLGLRPSRVQLFLEKTGRLPADHAPRTKAMRRGLRLEKYIVEAWNEDIMPDDPIVETQRFVRSAAMPWAGATLDGICRSGIHVEFKTSGLGGPVRRIDGPEDFESIPDAWAVQGAHQLMVTGGQQMYFAVVLPDLNVHAVGPWPRPEGLVRIVGDEVSRFWHDVILADVPPDEVHHEDARALARAFRGQTGEWLVLGEQASNDAMLYQRLGAEARAIDKLRDEARARLLLALGDAAGADCVGGWSVRRSVSTTKEHTVRESTRVTLSVRGPEESVAP